MKRISVSHEVLAKDYATGLSCRAVADKRAVSTATVHRAVVAAGVKPHQAGRPSKSQQRIGVWP